jgi:hypothetical protein
MLQVLVVISQKFCCREEACGYAKVIHKKARKKQKNWEKMDKCPRYPKEWVLNARLKKREEREREK